MGLSQDSSAVVAEYHAKEKDSIILSRIKQLLGVGDVDPQTLRGRLHCIVSDHLGIQEYFLDVNGERVFVCGFDRPKINFDGTKLHLSFNSWSVRGQSLGQQPRK